jgi:NDP-sugar pyrophosphorylase family protein
MSKNRLTITLSAQLLTQIDQLVDGQVIRNRSHAIEHLISQGLQPTVNQAVILAGGATEDSKEPLRELIVINDKPLILHTLEHLQKFGVTHVIIATNQRGRAIQELVGDGQQLGLSIEYHFEKTPLGTAGAIKAVANRLAPRPFIVWAGDIFTDINLHDLAAFHTEHQARCTIAVKPRPTKKTYDNVFMQGHTIVAFEPAHDFQEVSLVNAGVYLCEPSILKLIPTTPSMLEKDLFPQLTKTNKCVAFVFQGVWFDVISDENYQKTLESHHG